jgi:hypothetical protein
MPAINEIKEVILWTCPTFSFNRDYQNLCCNRRRRQERTRPSLSSFSMNYYWADLFNPRFLWPPRIIHYRKGRKGGDNIWRDLFYKEKRVNPVPPD